MHRREALTCLAAAGPFQLLDTTTGPTGAMGQPIDGFKVVVNVTFADHMLDKWIEDQAQRPVGKIVAIDYSESWVKLHTRPWDKADPKPLTLPLEIYSDDWKERLL